jgi:hypothetical protein
MEINDRLSELLFLHYLILTEYESKAGYSITNILYNVNPLFLILYKSVYIFCFNISYVYRYYLIRYNSLLPLEQ